MIGIMIPVSQGYFEDQMYYNPDFSKYPLDTGGENPRRTQKRI